MRPIISIFFIILTAVLSQPLAPSYCSATTNAAPSSIADPLTYFHKGIAAQTIGEREQYFEKALGLYLAQLNKMKADGQVNAMLCYNIGNCYFNLDQNEEAIYYYSLANKLLPGNEKILANMEVAKEKRENPIDIEGKGPLLRSLLFFHYRLSSAQRIHLAIGVSIAAALCLTWLILRPNIKARYSSILLSVISLSLLLSLAAEYYSQSYVGIIMQSTDIRRGAGLTFAPVTKRPLGGGSSVEVLAINNDWYNIRLNDGRTGFIARENIKLVVL